jgi:alpha-mannosidase
MNARLASLVFLSWISLPAAGRADEASPRETFWIIPHTHWEGAVFKTREQYLEMGLPHILKAVHLLKTQPDYRFVLDQVAYVRPFIERYPEAADDFRRFVKEGRLQLVLGMDIMPDVNMPGGETFVRQMQYGKNYYRDTFGVDVTAAWLIDTFGHHAQMPQLLTKAGYTSFWFSRGVPRPDHPSEFLWEGIDGTRIASFWLPYSYGLMYGSPRDLSAFTAFAKERFGALAPNSRGADRLGLSGVDVCEPEAHLAPLVAAFNRQADPPFALRLAVPSEFEAVAAKRPDRPVFKGELNPIFQGTYSSRIELKGRMRDLERRLTTAEKLGTIAGWLGHPADRRTLWRAWELVLFNETHDLSSGVMTDHVYDDTVRCYDFASRLADGLTETSWDAIAANVDTSGDGIPVVVFNSLAWTRSDLVELDLFFVDGSVAGLSVTDPDGKAQPVQLVHATRYDSGRLKTARVAWVARDTPSLGYAVYHVVPKPDGDLAVPKAGPRATLDNDLYELNVEPTSGAWTSLRAKSGDWEVFAGKANVVARTVDKGDFWELYRGLDGGSKIAMTTRQAVPPKGEAKLSDESAGDPGTIVGGPVFSEFRVVHPFDSGKYATTVRLVNGQRRIDVTTTLVNQEKYVRYQALFPTSIRGGKTVHEIPFGAIERPDGIEFPAQNWADYGDGKRGVAILNAGLPGNLTTDGTMMVSLLRAHNLGAYGFGGGYEPGMSSESGFQLGQERTMRYAVIPHSGDWREAGVFRDGLELNHPLIVRKVVAHAGKLPARWGFVSVSSPQVVMSALNPAINGRTILRVYEATGNPAPNVHVRFTAGVSSAHEADLLERPSRDLTVNGGDVLLDLGPFEVKTLAFELGASTKPK